ncbi:putative uncharacterized protein DDB_G0282133 [Ctenocephalides felis]|uniref:putative uncharacterized protein DDB_G0282133 n=1 Tax=Ctenocephalides felis TaxID=7515 RepID=UPI000E6E3ED7|nr:putative uncharacterized protein DDB_G0282133 [Ctenocephalides felis]
MDIIQDENKHSSSEKTVDSLEDLCEKVVEETSADKEIMSQTKEPEEIPDTEKMDSAKSSDEMSKSFSEEPQKSQAFTIDFGDGKQIDSTKHKFLMDKLKKRHQRGASLSKLEDTKPSKSTMSKSKTTQGVSKLAKTNHSKESVQPVKQNTRASAGKNKMPMSVSFHESSNFGLDSKSLSPRTSFHESYSEEVNLCSLPNISTHEETFEPPHSTKESNNDVSNDYDSNSDVSETGTYTIENDTYTEEQKAKMSIDQKLNSTNTEVIRISIKSTGCDNNIKHEESPISTKNISKTIINTQDLTPDCSNNEELGNFVSNGHKQYTPSKVSSDKNVLEVSYYYEPQEESKARSRKSVLENNKNKNEFGVRNELDILLKRKKSLTKSEIESSDYVEPDSKLNNSQLCDLNKPSKDNNKFENNWIYEWAKSASEHNRRERDKANNEYRYRDSSTDNASDYYGNKQNSHRAMSLPLGRTNNDRINDSIVKRPPRPPSASPTKIPSPISTLARPRSRNSVSLSGSTTELNSPIADTHAYLRNTEDVINILSCSLSNSTGPKVSNYATYSDSRNGSPMHSLDSSTSPKHISYVTISSDGETRLSQSNDYNTRPLKSESSPTSPKRTFGPSRHKRHFSFDNSLSKIEFASPSHNRLMNNSLTQKNNLSKAVYEHSHNLKKHDYIEKNNKDLGYGDQLPPKPIKCFINKNDTNSKLNIDQTISVSKDNLLKSTFKDNNLQINNKNSFNDVRNKLAKHQNSPNSSPIRRSSSFSSHANDTPLRSRHNNTPFMDSPRSTRKYTNYNNYHDNNDNFSDGIKSDYEYENDKTTPKPEKIKNTRCNRAFSLRRARLESEKSDTSVSATKQPASNFVRNNADSTRRSVRSSFREKSTGPRDISINKRLANPKPSENVSDVSSAGQKKVTASVQPRYMDISKYKSPTTASFLKKDESKSYLETKSVPGSAAKNKNLTRNDDIRLSLRSTRSAGPGKGVIKKDIVPVRNPTKEQEMANWKRRAKYDPMKAAAEGRKKAELAKKIASSNIMTQSFNENENYSPLQSGGAVLRSQSYHGAVGLEWLSGGNSKAFGFNRGESISDTSDDGLNY